MARRLSRALALTAVALAIGCTSTQFIHEGSGQPSDRATGAVPEGSLGACKRPNTKRPPIVDQKLWDDTKPCTSRTPLAYVRLGYGSADPADPEADKRIERILQGLRDGQKEDSGNAQFTTMLRALRADAAKEALLRDRVSKDPSRAETCDFTYLLNTMSKERGKVEPGKTCPAEVYDPKVKGEVCLFDTARGETSWLTSSWSCVTHTGVVGEEQSCHRLCAYDDYCARQVNCASSDLDLVMCALGVCLPEQRAGFYGAAPP